MGSGWENLKIQLALKGLINSNPPDRIPFPIIAPIESNDNANFCRTGLSKSEDSPCEHKMIVLFTITYFDRV